MPPDHFELIMAEIRGLRVELHDMRRDMQSEAVRVATHASAAMDELTGRLSRVEAFINRMIGGGMILGGLSGLLGSYIPRWLKALFT